MKRLLSVLAVVVTSALLAAAQIGAPAGAGRTAQASDGFRDFKPVTDAMLENPDPADWINFRRTLDAWGYSPLNQINTRNVDQLQLVWSQPLGPGNTQPSSLVYMGVMYIPLPLGRVRAVNAVTGDLLWEYAKTFETPPDTYFGSRMRSLAIRGDTIIANTNDAHIIALNARTGALVWDHTVANYKLGYRYSTGPIIAKGKIIAGMTGCERYKDDICFISAHDPDTGKELWRTSTIARPGEPGGETWGDLPLKRRAGGDAWMSGSYDPKANLIYWSTAQAKPWARVSRGTDGDALYTNSTLALDPDTGRIVWYHQFIPGETHDLDEVFENILIDYDGRTSLFKMGKLGILWELDRKTGKFRRSHDLGYQTLVDVEPESGKVTYRPGMIPQANVPLQYCPDTNGIKNRWSMSYDPEIQVLVLPIHPSCTKGVFFEVAEESVGDFYFYQSPEHTGARLGGSTRHPKSLDHEGYMIAMDIRTGEIRWRHPTETVPASAALTTAGGIAIASDAGHLFVDDVRTGKVLFQARLPTTVTGYPITYAVRGRQYLAVPTGNAGTAGGAAMYVFALPNTGVRR